MDFTAPDRTELRKDALATLANLHDSALLAVTGGASAVERDSWPTKQRAAEHVLAGNASAIDTALLSPEAAHDKLSLVELAQKIIAAATAHATFAGQAKALLDAGKAEIRMIFDDNNLDDIAANTQARAYLEEARKAIPLKIAQTKAALEKG